MSGVGASARMPGSALAWGSPVGSARSRGGGAGGAGAPAQEITSFDLSGTGTGSFSVGVGIAKGDAPDTLVTDLATAQVVVKARWNDGSVKHAIVSGEGAMPQTVTLSTSTATPPAGLTEADIQAEAPTASVVLSSFGTVNLSSLLGSPFRTWISGPQMVEAHYRAAVGSDPTLVVWYHVRLWSSGRMWVRAIVENGYINVTTSNKTYTATVTIGGSTVFNASVTNYANTRWCVEGWIGGTPDVTPRHETIYLQETTKLVPNYWKRNPTSAAFTGLVETYTPMNRGNLTQDMSEAGFQAQIGLLPLWDALYVSSADARAYRSCLANSSSMNTYPIVWRDSSTNLPPRPADWTTYGLGGGGSYNWTAGANTWNYSHAPSEGYLAYLVTGDYWHYETMLFHTAMNYLALGDSVGSGVSRLMLGDTRGHAWAMRTLVQLCGIAPTGDTVAANYRTMLANNIDHFEAVRDTLGGVGLGYLYEYGFPYGTGILAPWQDHFVIQALGLGSDLEPLADMTNFITVRDWWYRGAVGILGDASGHCFAEASAYNTKISDTSNTDPTTWYETWAEVYTANFGAKPCGNTLLGESGGNPSAAHLGYWGNLLPAISYAVDHGASGAATALARIPGASNYATFEGCDWANTPIWGISPRTGNHLPPISALGTLAASLGSDAWGELSTNLADDGMILVGPEGVPCIQWAFNLAGYDPVQKKIPFVGGGHGAVPNTRHLVYTESTNLWTLEAAQSWWPQTTGQVMHGYAHNAMDPDNGQMYHHKFGVVNTYRWTVASATWDSIANVTSNPDAPTIGTAYFPERGGLVLAGGGQVWFWTRSSNTWALEASGLTMGTYNNWAIYNPVREEVLFGGGNDSPAIWTMSNTGTRTQKADAPTNMPVGTVYGTCDPISGMYFFFDRNGNTEFVFRTFNAATNTWGTRTMPDFGFTVNINAVILPAIVPAYGVNFMLVWQLSHPQVWVYKY